jgi:hypothetical protein
MEYVRTLEKKVRQYRNMHRRFKALSFALGFATGALVLWIVRSVWL